MTERNAARVYQRLCRHPQHAKKKRSGCLAHLLAPSVIGVCVCVVCLCGASWACFTTTASTGVGEIQAAVYTVSVTAAPGEVTVAENGAAKLTLDAGQTYTVTVEPTGTATGGYCKVLLEGEDDDEVYYTVQCVSGKLTFTVYASENGTLTVTPEWGTCAIEGQKIGKGEGDLKKIGTKPTDSTTPGTNGISNAPAASETVLETTAPVTELPQSEPEETVPATVPAEIESTSETTE